jgi:hypothetical protein
LTWGSELIGDDYDAYTEELDSDKAWVMRQLLQHPLMKQATAGATFATDSAAAAPGNQGAGSLPPPKKVDTPEDAAKKKEEQDRLKDEMAVSTGEFVEGWFEDTFGKSPSTIVKDLRRKRRVHKALAPEIDEAITVIRLAKAAEVDQILNSIEWAPEHMGSIKSLGVSDKDLRALRKFGKSREVSLKQACLQWENSNDVISKLSSLDGDFTKPQEDQWVTALKLRKESKQMWKSTLHQSDKLSNRDALSLEKAVNLLTEHGAMSSRGLLTHMTGEDGRNRGLPSSQQLGALMKTYGPEYNIVKSGPNWEVLTNDLHLVMKDPWAYAAGFLDADGYITISKRGEPRAGIVATGLRGKHHCENLYKMLECGVLSLDLKVHKSSKRSQHRLQFYSKDDLTKLLKGVLPHLRLKKHQAKYVLEHLSLRGQGGDLIVKRRDELYRLVKWENWSDVKADELLEEWKVDEQEVLSWAERDPEMMAGEVF